ncbi:hypothetical protein ACQUJV_24390 [Ralstonia pseudosolanacearum]
MLKSISHLPNTPVASRIEIVDPHSRNYFEMFFSYCHSKKIQIGQVKIYRNNISVEHIVASISQDEILVEVIDENEHLFEHRIPTLSPDEAQFPIEFSKQSTHPLAQKLRAVFASLPSLPNLEHFGTYAPSAIVVESGNRLILVMPHGESLEFDPQNLFNVGGDVADDFIGCLFGPFTCAISVAVAILLYSRKAQ